MGRENFHLFCLLVVRSIKFKRCKPNLHSEFLFLNITKNLGEFIQSSF